MALSFSGEKTYTEGFCHAVLHFCSNGKGLRMKTWEKLRSVGIRTSKNLDIVWLYYVGSVLTLRAGGEKDFCVLTFGFLLFVSNGVSSQPGGAAVVWEKQE